MELEGRMSEMCNVSDYWEEVATEEGKEIGEKQKIISLVVKKLQKDKSVAEIADDPEEKRGGYRSNLRSSIVHEARL